MGVALSIPFSIVSLDEVWKDGRWVRDYQIFDYARIGLQFASGHIPGAVWIEKTLVWTEVDSVSGMLPQRENLAYALSLAGFDPSRPALVYDDGNGLYAARLAWALSVAGWKEVGLLEGGLTAWRKAQNPLRFGFGQAGEVRSWPPVWNSSLYATFRDVQDRESETVLLDVRSRDEYTGKQKKSRRAGRIPGSVWWEWKNGLSNDQLSFRKKEELVQDFERIGIRPGVRVITYCQSGVRAAHALFSLVRAGITHVSNYDGSWEEWGNRSDLPLEWGGVE